MPFLIPAAIAIGTAVEGALTVAAAALSGAVFAATGSGALALAVSSALPTVVELGALAGASALLAPHPKVNTQGSPQAFKPDTNAGIPVIEGRYGVGGNLVYETTSGGSNKAAAGAQGNEYLTQFVILSGLGPVNAVESLRFNDTILTWSGQQCTGGYIPDDEVQTYNPGYKQNSDGTYQNNIYNNHAWQNFQLGALNAGYFAPPTKLASDNAALSEWTSAHGFSSFCAVALSIVYDQTVYTGGVPQPQWTVQGGLRYDPRQDSTFPGGSGACRWVGPGASAAAIDAAWSTRIYNTNPIIAALNYALGYFLPDPNTGLGRLYAGIGAGVTGVDIPAFVRAANIADANGWLICGQWTTDDGKWNVLNEMLKAGSASAVIKNGLISCIVDTPLTSLGTITADDLSGPVKLPTGTSFSARINTITPRYSSEAHRWQMVPAAAPVEAQTYVAEDGAVRSKTLDWQYVPAVNQACQLAAYTICNGREITGIELPGKPKLRNYGVGDCLTVNIPEAGLANAKVMVTKRLTDPATGGVTLTVRTETDAKHAYSLGVSGVAPPTPGISGYDPTILSVPLPASWSSGVFEYFDEATGESRVIIQITGEVDTPYAQNLLVRYRSVLQVNGAWTPVGSGAWNYKSYPASQTQFELDLNPGSFDVQIAYTAIGGAYPSSDANWLDLGIETVGGSTVGLAVSMQASTGGNACVDTLFNFTSLYWGDGTNSTNLAYTQSVTTLGGRPAFQKSFGSQHPAAGKVFNIGQAAGSGVTLTDMAIPCQAGQRIEASAYVAASAVATASCFINFYDANGTFLGSLAEGNAAASNLLGSGNYGLQSYVRIGGIDGVPADGTYTAGTGKVAYATMGVQATTNGDTSNPCYLSVVAPVLRIALAGQVGLSNYTAGVENQLGADITADGTSAHVYGQGTGATTNVGALATLNAVTYGQSSAVGFGALAGLGSVTFGSANLLEASGGAQATLANFKTSQGTSAYFNGQGSLATLGSVGYGSSYLTGFGSLAGLGAVNFGSANLLEAAGGAQATLANFKTSQGTSAYFSGQGSLATLSSVGYGSSYLTGFGALAPLGAINFGSSYLLESSGGAQATLANFKTSQGTAAYLNGQSYFATGTGYGGLTGVPGALGIQGDGRLYAGNISYSNGGPTALSLQPATANADQTINATAGHLYGAGTGAYASSLYGLSGTDYQRLFVPGAANVVTDPTGKYGGKGWSFSGTAGVAVENGYDWTSSFYVGTSPSGCLSPAVNFGQTQYTLQAELTQGSLAGGSVDMAVDVAFYSDAAGTVQCKDGNGNPIYSARLQIGWSGSAFVVQSGNSVPASYGWGVLYVTGIGPSNALTARVRVYTENCTGGQGYVRRIQLRANSNGPFPWTDDNSPYARAGGVYGAGVDSYMDGNAVIKSGAGMPYGVSTAYGVTFSPTAPMSSPSSSEIDIAATTITMPGVSYSSASAKFTGLAAGATYLGSYDRINNVNGINLGDDPTFLINYNQFIVYGTQQVQNSSGGYTAPVYTGGGGKNACPDPDMPFLLANAAYDGPGETIRCGDVRPGMFAWTADEHEFRWGAYEVLAAEVVEAEDRWAMHRDGLADWIGSAEHPWLVELEGWVALAGLKPGDQLLGCDEPVAGVSQVAAGPVVRISTTAGTYVSTALCHNKSVTGVNQP